MRCSITFIDMDSCEININCHYTILIIPAILPITILKEQSNNIPITPSLSSTILPSPRHFTSHHYHFHKLSIMPPPIPNIYTRTQLPFLMTSHPVITIPQSFPLHYNLSIPSPPVLHPSHFTITTPRHHYQHTLTILMH